MPDLNVASVALTLRAHVLRDELEQHLPIAIDLLANDLAGQVFHAVRTEKLGYYPALDYFRTHPGVDTGVLDMVEQVAWLAAESIGKLIRQRLRGIFSTVRIEGLQSLAFTMPRVRVGQPNAEMLLAQHFDPSSVKADLYLSLLQRRVTTEGLGGFSRRMLTRWLGPHVERLEISSVRTLKGSG